MLPRPKATWAVTLTTNSGVTETSRKRVNVISAESLEATIKRLEAKAYGADTVAIVAPTNTLYALGFQPGDIGPTSVTFPSGRTVPRGR